MDNNTTISVDDEMDINHAREQKHCVSHTFDKLPKQLSHISVDTHHSMFSCHNQSKNFWRRICILKLDSLNDYSQLLYTLHSNNIVNEETELSPIKNENINNGNDINSINNNNTTDQNSKSKVMSTLISDELNTKVFDEDSQIINTNNNIFKHATSSTAINTNIDMNITDKTKIFEENINGLNNNKISKKIITSNKNDLISSYVLEKNDDMKCMIYIL